MFETSEGGGGREEKSFQITPRRIVEVREGYGNRQPSFASGRKLEGGTVAGRDGRAFNPAETLSGRGGAVKIGGISRRGGELNVSPEGQTNRMGPALLGLSAGR